MRSSHPQLNFAGPDWVLLKVHLTQVLDRHMKDLKDHNHDHAYTQYLRGRIAALESVLKLEDRAISGSGD